VAISADGRRAITGDDRTVRVWDPATGKRIAPASQRLRHWFARSHWACIALSITMDGRRAVSGGYDGKVRVWDLETGTTVHTLTGHGQVTSVAISADGRRAITGSYNGAVQLWDLETGTAVHTLTGHSGWVSAVAVSADGRRAITGGGRDGTVRVWDVPHGVELASFASDSGITVLAVTPLGTRVIAGTASGPVHLLELCAYEQPAGA
jgi:WD40 repeat protein